ncbi:MAG: hypothetical protein ACKODX_12280, partial [Gemmata sp.]
AEAKKDVARQDSPKAEGPKAPKPEAKAHAAKEEAKPANLPANGLELHRRLREYDAKLADQKVCPLGALLAHVTQAGVKAGLTENLNEWSGDAIQFAVNAVRDFDQAARKDKPEPRTAA